MPIPSDIATSINSPRLLCVDDDERFLKVFTFFLQEVGFEVLSTTDPDKAPELASSFPIPDLAILDFQMPRCNGIELASVLKTLRPGLPILIFSGDDQLAVHRCRLLQRMASRWIDRQVTRARTAYAPTSLPYGDDTSRLTLTFHATYDIHSHSQSI